MIQQKQMSGRNNFIDDLYRSAKCSSRAFSHAKTILESKLFNVFLELSDDEFLDLFSKENDNGLGKSYSDSVLKSTYNKFNLREDSYNSSIIKQPFILSGIQRKKGEPQTLGFGSFSFIRGGAITSTARAAIDVARFTQFLLTPRGITWTAKQVGMQRSQKYGKKFTPDFFSPPYSFWICTTSDSV